MNLLNEVIKELGAEVIIDRFKCIYYKASYAKYECLACHCVSTREPNDQDYITPPMTCWMCNRKRKEIEIAKTNAIS